MSTGLSTSNVLAAARLKACQTWPYVSSALLSLVPVEKPGLGTMAVDAYWRLYYDPAILQKWSVKEVAGVLLHEVCHVIRNHSKRFGNALGFDPEVAINSPTTDLSTRLNVVHLAKVWNYAGDCEINDDLVSQKITLPAANPPVLPKDFGFPDGLLCEDYYSRLRNQQPQGGSGKGKGKGKNGKGAGEGQGEGEGDSDSELQAGVPGAQPSGSGADGVQRPWEAGKPNSNDPKQPEGISEGQADLIRHEVARRVQQAAKERGNVPAGFRRWADSIIEPKIDYRRELVTQVKQALELIRGHSNQTYTRIARKQYQGGIVAPATVCPNVTVSVIIDTSGSMSDGDLGEAVSELSGILKALPRQDGVKVFAVDSAVHTAQKCFRPEQVILAGGGGTSMAVGIETACKQNPRPQLCIILTDGYTDWLDEPVNGVPCLAVIVSNGQETAPAWIKQIKLPSGSLDKT